MYIRTLHSRVTSSLCSTRFRPKATSISVFSSTAIRMASSQNNKRRFAPLGQPGTDGAPALKGIVFDMDGTLCEPQNYMFGEMRAALSIDKGTDILDHIYSLPTSEQEAAHAKIQAIERKAMELQVPQAGLVTLMEFLDRHGVKKGICTRNFDTPVTHLLSTHLPSHISAFHPIVTREFRPPKPSPAGILHIAKAWGIDTSGASPHPETGKQLPLIMVGDSIDDIIAGYDAGALTVLVKSPGKEELEVDERTHVVVERLDELVGLLEGGIEAK